MGTACSSQTHSTATEDVLESQQGVDGVVSVPGVGERKLNWRRDPPDFRDRFLALPESKTVNLPPAVDLRPKENFAVYDQGTLGSCTANAIAAAFHFSQIREGIVDFAPSRLFIYYNERAMEGHADKDTGAALRDGVKCLQQQGVCKETTWPYDITVFAQKPSPEGYDEAMKNTCKTYARVAQTLDDLRGCINEGYPFVFGFLVLSSFMRGFKVAETGIMVMPQTNDKILGGHAVMAVGYDDERQVFIVRNSWSAVWGDQGYFYMPYTYIVWPGLASDFWAVQTVDGTEFPCRPGP